MSEEYTEQESGEEATIGEDSSDALTLEEEAELERQQRRDRKEKENLTHKIKHLEKSLEEKDTQQKILEEYQIRKRTYGL